MSAKPKPEEKPTERRERPTPRDQQRPGTVTRLGGLVTLQTR